MVETLSPPAENADSIETMPRWNFGRDFWRFFTAAFFFDAGFALYFFLFNLFLADLHYGERAIGSVNAALTLGSLLGTLPAGETVRRYGIRPLLLICFVSAPLLGAARALCTSLPAETWLAFVMGLAMSCWGVCFLPAVSRLTTPRTRSSAFSLIFAVSVGTSALGGFLCSQLPSLIATAGVSMSSVDVKRLVLLTSCGTAALGVLALLRLRMPAATASIDQESTTTTRWADWRKAWKLDRFLAGFLPSMALWSGILAVTSVFANVYLTRQFGIPLRGLSLIFSCAQILQLGATLLMPRLVSALSRRNAITLVQATAAVALLALGLAHTTFAAVGFYLVLSIAQWMSSPVLYDMLMHATPDYRRGTVAAMTMFGNGLSGAAATALAGVLLSRFGYHAIFPMLAIAAILICLVFRRANLNAEPSSTSASLSLH
jgi:MFS family permease